jgi:hypothetical protein
MAQIDIQDVGRDMINAAKGVLINNWAEVKPYAENEFKNLARNLELIIDLKVKGKIDEEQSKLYLNIYKSSVQIVLLSIQGMGLLMVENAINAALSVVGGVVNTVIGFPLL